MYAVVVFLDLPNKLSTFSENDLRSTVTFGVVQIAEKPVIVYVIQKYVAFDLTVSVAVGF